LTLSAQGERIAERVSALTRKPGEDLRPSLRPAVIGTPAKTKVAEVVMAKHRIIPTDQWGAVPSKGPIVPAGTPTEIIFHHTDGHHPNLDNKPSESRAEGAAYARSLQHDHMVNRGFIDSGHNFLVTRSGHIFEGRHGSKDAIKAGKMVVSAHCIGHNTQPGIEHEQRGGEPMTAKQREASLWLHALICRKTGMKPSAIHEHREFNATECPGVLRDDLKAFRRDLAERLPTD
jgi:hypothetical protein